MSIYKSIINPHTGELQLFVDTALLKIKGTVNTPANLPLTGNSENDCYIVKSNDRLYTWNNTSSSGILTDWVDVGSVSSVDWSIITNKPVSSVSDIDDSVSKKHTQGTDQGLDTGGVNAVTALQVKQAITDDHTHSNKTILDNIQEALTTVLKTAYDTCVTFISNFNLGTPLTDDILAWNGVQFVPKAPQVTGFKGVDLFFDDSLSGISTYFSLLPIPTGGIEQLDNIIVNANTVHGEDYISGVLGGTQIDAGVWQFDIYRYISSGPTSGTTEFIIEVYKRTSGGTETLLFTVATGDVNDTVNTLQTITTVQPAYVINSTDRLLLKFYGHRIEVGNRTITLTHNGTAHYSHIHTPLVLRHNDLAGLQGGTTGQFNHLTNAQLIDVNTIAGLQDDMVSTAFRVAILGDYSEYDMVSKTIDEYEDQSGIDLGLSTDIIYDSLEECYKPYDDLGTDTVFLSHFDGLDGATTADDESASAHLMTFNGEAQLKTAEKIFGASSLYLDGTGDYLSIPDSDDWDFGANDFTIDSWIRPTSNAHHHCPISAGDSLTFWRLLLISDGSVAFNSAISGVFQSDYSWPFGWTPNNWYHLAIVRNGTNLYCFKDGTLLSGSASTLISTNSVTNGTGQLEIGRVVGLTSEYYEGYLDELRVSKGIARWTSNFSVPVLPYSGTISNMVLISNAKAIGVSPSTIRVICRLEEIDSLILNTDLIVEVSRDNGTTWSAVILSDINIFSSNSKIIGGSTDVSGQPSGTSLRYKVSSLNNKNFKLHGTARLWN